MIDGYSSVLSCSSCSLDDRERARQICFGDHCVVKVKNHILKLGRVLRDDGLYSMIGLVRERLKSKGLCMAEARL